MSRKKHNSLNFAVSMTLFTVFALFLTMVLLTGASSFKNISASADARNSERTPLLYITQKIRSNDRLMPYSPAGSVQIAIIDSLPVLVLGAGEEIMTYIYFYEGYLTELYAFADEVPNLRIGTPLFQTDTVAFEEQVVPSLLRITIGAKSIYVNLSAGRIAYEA